jgi:hypothetical protein
VAENPAGHDGRLAHGGRSRHERRTAIPRVNWTRQNSLRKRARLRTFRASVTGLRRCEIVLPCSGAPRCGRHCASSGYIPGIRRVERRDAVVLGADERTEGVAHGLRVEDLWIQPPMPGTACVPGMRHAEEHGDVAFTDAEVLGRLFGGEPNRLLESHGGRVGSAALTRASGSNGSPSQCASQAD